MEIIRTVISSYSELIKSNPIVAGLAGMYGMTVLLFVFKSIPMRILAFLKRQFTTTLLINNTSMGSNMESFNNFLRWFEKSKWTKFSRTLSLNGGWYEYGPKGEDGTVVGIGDGQHFCFYKGRPIWIFRRRLENTQSHHQINYEISITMLGRNRKIIEDMIEEFRYRRRPDKVGVFVFDTEWKRIGEVRKRDLKTVIIDPEVKAQIIAKIDKWLGSAEWHYDRGFAYKLTMLLHGIPGSGKTSLIKAIAGHYQKNLCLIHLASMSDILLRNALASVPDNSIIALEDFDDVDSIHARSGMGKNPYEGVTVPNKSEGLKLARPGDISVSASGVSISSKKAGPSEEGAEGKKESFFGITMSGMLNALDGLLSLDGTIIFMTTNRPEIFDPALMRKGRINETFNLGALRSPQVHEYIELMYPDLSYDRTIQFADIAGCNLEGHYKDNVGDPEKFIDILPKAQPQLSLITSEKS
ncbi:AAA family ATPase [Stenotrophomonas sp. GD03657]|uniref:AAA family ATPase n=1 Tax=Stenotrophomonas sp. GD03657 TaxID=2975363 RepID=UPI0024494C6D|nr:AAA family ATPase [Stenotrophomonas sp. GD03657]MDH2154075.1 AAA family ATPase [Stenotrophomonas sp. GD03657]